MKFILENSIKVEKKQLESHARRTFFKYSLAGLSGVATFTLLPQNVSANIWGEIFKKVIKKAPAVAARGIPLLGAGIVGVEIAKTVWEIYEEITAEVVVENDTNEEKKGELKVELVSSETTNEIEFASSKEVTIPPNTKNTYKLAGISSSTTGKFELIIESENDKGVIDIEVVDRKKG